MVIVFLISSTIPSIFDQWRSYVSRRISPRRTGEIIVITKSKFRSRSRVCTSAYKTGVGARIKGSSVRSGRARAGARDFDALSISLNCAPSLSYNRKRKKRKTFTQFSIVNIFFPRL